MEFRSREMGMADQTDTQVFRYCRRELLRLAAIGVAVVFLLSVLVFELFGYQGSGDLESRFMYVLVCATLVFMVWVLWVFIRKLGRGDRPVLVLSPDGLFDARVSPRTIPWPDIQDIRSVEKYIRGQKIEYTAVSLPANHPAARAMAFLDRLRFSGAGEPGYVDLYILDVGLAVTFDDMHRSILAQYRRHGRPSDELPANDARGP